VKVALLSDIHGNIDALEPVLESIRKSGLEKILVAGDLVGYYYDPNLVLAELSKFETVFVKGNHEVILEELLEKKISHSDIQKYYGSAHALALESLTPKQIEFLCNLPDMISMKIENAHINLSHGSPWKLDEYLYPDVLKENWQKFNDYIENVFIVGNTHHQMLKRIGGKLIINPGSIGQSRSDIGCAQWAKLDTDTLEVTFISTPYDTSSLKTKCAQLDPGVLILRKSL
jgi:putative phosphoesterase